MTPQVLRMLARQQHELIKNPPSGVIFYPNEEGDMLDIQADIVGPVDTAYQGGVFRCRIVIENGFP